MPQPLQTRSWDTLLDLLQLRARESPHAEAYTFLVDGERDEVSLTYRQLWERAQAVGAALQGHGHVGERAIILCPAGLDYFTAFYGCVAAGWIAVPAYAPRPAEQLARLRSIMRSSQPRIGLTTREMLPAIQEALGGDTELAALPWMCVDAVRARAGDAWIRPALDRDSLVSIIYTSGSTAEPKGVVRANRDLPVSLTPGAPELNDEPECRHRIVSWTPPNNLAIAVIALAHAVPATYMAPEAFIERPARWIELLSRTGATYALAPNFAYDLAVRAIPPEERSRLDLSNWKYAYMNGEQVRAETIRRFVAAFAPSGLQPSAITCSYGLTEIWPISTAMTGERPTILSFDRPQLERGYVSAVSEDEPSARVLVGQGKPNAHVEVLIVDPETCLPLPTDRVGEVWTRGTHVAVGYWHAPEETRAAFHAFRRDTGDGPYFRTGDLGFLHHGELYITGRHKEIIIVRGRNIHAADVELVAQHSHPALHTQAGAAFAIDTERTDALVMVQEVDPSSDDHACTAIATAIRRAIPQEIGIQVETVALVPPGAIPRTDLGKLRRLACRTRYLDGTLPLLFTVNRHQRHTAYVPPSTSLERALVAIWEAVLGVQPVGIEDDFLDLGGDSLTSLQVLARMHEHGIHAGMDQVRRHGTIAALARSIADQPVSAEEEPVVGPVPALLMHHGVLGIRPELPADLTLTMQLAVREPLHPELLTQAAQQVVLHHDALRLRFQFIDGRWQADCVGYTPHQLVSSLDLSSLPPEEVERRIAAETEQLRSQVDVGRGQLLHIGLIHLGQDAGDRLVICLSHLAFDAISRPILLHDLETAYTQLDSRQPISLPPKTTSIRRWGEALRTAAASTAMQEEVSYWRAVLAAAPSVLPADATEEEPCDQGITDIWTVLDEEATTCLQHVAPARCGIRLVDALLWTIARAIADRTGLSTVLLDLFGAGRVPLEPDIDLSRTLGYFTTLVPLRLELTPDAGPLEAAAQVREQLERVPRQGIGFDLLRYLCHDPICDGLRVPDRPIRLNYLGESDVPYAALTRFIPFAANTDAADEVPRMIVIPAEQTELIDIAAYVANRQLRVRINYHTAVYRRETIASFAAAIGRDLSHVARSVEIQSHHGLTPADAARRT